MQDKPCRGGWIVLDKQERPIFWEEPDRKFLEDCLFFSETRNRWEGVRIDDCDIHYNFKRWINALIESGKLIAYRADIIFEKGKRRFWGYRVYEIPNRLLEVTGPPDEYVFSLKSILAFEKDNNIKPNLIPLEQRRAERDKIVNQSIAFARENAKLKAKIVQLEYELAQKTETTFLAGNGKITSLETTIAAKDKEIAALQTKLDELEEQLAQASKSEQPISESLWGWVQVVYDLKEQGKSNREIRDFLLPKGISRPQVAILLYPTSNVIADWGQFTDNLK